MQIPRTEEEPGGLTLEELLYERPLQEDEALRMMAELCRELGRWERKKTVHGNLRPEHIFISEEGCAGLRTDTGGREILSGTGIEERKEASDADAKKREAASEVSAWDDAYLSPECFHRRGCDCRSDLYSLGLIFYRVMNRGREPFVSVAKQIVGYGDRKKALEMRMGGAPLPAPAQSSPEFARILQKACAFDPKDRYQSAAQLGKALERCRRKKRNKLWRRARSLGRRQKAAAAAVLLAGLCIVSAWLWQRQPVLIVQGRADGISGTLSRSGTLTLTGEGILKAEHWPVEWDAYRGEIKRLVIRGKVTEMDLSFQDYPVLEEVEFPEGMERLSGNLFGRCGKLREVHFPSSLRTIGANAFLGCSALKHARLPENLEAVGYGAFEGCTELAEIEIPASLQEIDASSFEYTKWEEEQQENGDFLVANHILVKYFGEEADLVIPEELAITQIAGNAFCGNDALRSVAIPDSVEKLGRSCFMDCKNLVSASLPEGITEIPEDMFAQCISLEEAVIPDGVERIGASAFVNCKKLRRLTVPETVSSIGAKAFYQTDWFSERLKDSDYVVVNDILIEWIGTEEELVIPQELGIRHIADGACEGNSRLKRLVIPEGVVSLGRRCFYICSALEQIEAPEGLKEIGADAFGGTKWEKDLREKGAPCQLNGVKIRRYYELQDSEAEILYP